MNNSKISVPPITIVAILFVVMFGSYVIKHGSIVFSGANFVMCWDLDNIHSEKMY
jgi:hypothetical protein